MTSMRMGGIGSLGTGLGAGGLGGQFIIIILLLNPF